MGQSMRKFFGRTHDLQPKDWILAVGKNLTEAHELIVVNKYWLHDVMTEAALEGYRERIKEKLSKGWATPGSSGMSKWFKTRRRAASANSC